MPTAADSPILIFRNVAAVDASAEAGRVYRISQRGNLTQKNARLRVIAHVINEKTFTVESKEPLGDKVFVYGKECLDLKGVNYDAISMLNVSATQELAKQVVAARAKSTRAGKKS